MPRAVVSRGGRADLAGEALSRVQAPTLLIVAGQDELLIELNREAMAAIPVLRAEGTDSREKSLIVRLRAWEFSLVSLCDNVRG